MRQVYLGRKFVVLFCIAAIAGCGGSGGNSVGTVSISLMDRPVDGVTALYVTIDAIRIKPQGNGPPIELPMTSTPLTVDLLSLTDDNAAVLVHEAVVDAGTYNWIEFTIDDSDITRSYAMTNAGGQVPVDVDVPSDKIRLVSGFEVGVNQAVRFLFDWETSTGLTEAVGRNLYILKSAFRILRVDNYGSISGKLTSGTAMTDPVCSTVADPMVGKVAYFFDGTVTPDDIDGNDAEPVTTADATFDSVVDGYAYRAALMPGNYTVAFTCLGDKETDAGNEDLMFLSPLGDAVVEVSTESPVEHVDF